MTSAHLAIMLFLLIPIIGLFVLPFKVNSFHRNDILDNILRKGCFIVMLLLLGQTTAIAKSIAARAFLGGANNDQFFL